MWLLFCVFEEGGWHFFTALVWAHFCTYTSSSCLAFFWFEAWAAAAAIICTILPTRGSACAQGDTESEQERVRVLQVINFIHCGAVSVLGIGICGGRVKMGGGGALDWTLCRSRSLSGSTFCQTMCRPRVVFAVVKNEFKHEPYL